MARGLRPMPSARPRLIASSLPSWQRCAGACAARGEKLVGGRPVGRGTSGAGTYGRLRGETVPALEAGVDPDVFWKN